MPIPLVCLVLGIAILLYAGLAYRGSRLLKPILIGSKQKRNLALFIGSALIALALSLGMVGYLGYVNGFWLRYLRIIIGTVGLLLVVCELGKIWVGSDSFKSLRLKVGLQWQQLQRYWELLDILVARNLKGRYRGSFLGVYWSLLNPLIMTGLYTAIFGATFARYYGNSTLNYILAAFTGLIVINFFTASTSQALSSVVGNGSLLNKVRLPISIFPVSMIVANVFQLAVGCLPLLAIVTLITSQSLINLLALFLPLTALILVCTGIGLIVAALYVFFRDLPYFYELVCFVLWISSPVFYPSAIIPANVRPFLFLNPLLPIIESIRQISLSGDLPDLSLMGHSWLSAVIILGLGWTCFRAWQSQFMDLL